MECLGRKLSGREPLLVSASLAAPSPCDATAAVTMLIAEPGS